MSGLDQLKKKAKMSIDEMFETPVSGNPEIQKVALMESGEDGKLDIPISGNLDVHPSIHKTRNPESKISRKTENQKSGGMDIPISGKQEKQIAGLSSKKQAAFKMTFSLTEGAFKAFNDLYARRILEGRKTDKSDLICEAIYDLVDKESKRKR